MAELTFISAVAEMIKMQELVKAYPKGHQSQQNYLALTWDIVFLQNLMKFLDLLYSTHLPYLINRYIT